MPIIERLDTNGVASQHEIIAVVNGKREHAIQLLHTIRSLFLKEVENDLCVRLSLELVSGGEFGSEFSKIVDLAVANDSLTASVGQNGLPTMGDIHDGQTGVTQHFVSMNVKASVVRASMGKSVQHSVDRCLIFDTKASC
jgi:hypothetical protein